MKLSSIACASIGALAVCALGATGAFAAAKVVSHSNTNNNRSTTTAMENVYFQNLSPKGQDALKRLCAEHGGQVVTNDKGQMGCQVGSLNDSKNISDGAAKGQANE